MIRGAEQIAVAALNQAVRVARVGVVEGGEGGDAAAAGSQLEHRTVAVRPASPRDAKQIAVAVFKQVSRKRTVGFIEGGEGGNAAPRRQLEHRAIATCAAIL
jgi:hypothetical protein